MATVKSSTSISVQWGLVDPCRDRNGEITGYSVRYGVDGTSQRQTKRVPGEESNGGMTIISGLKKETVYRVEVAGVTSAGTGVYSDSITLTTHDGELQ